MIYTVLRILPQKELPVKDFFAADLSADFWLDLSSQINYND